MGLLTILGRQSSEFLDQPNIDWELRAAAPPYDGLGDLLNEYRLGDLRQVASVEIAAFNVAAVDVTSTVEGEIAKLKIRLAPRLDPTKITLGYRVLDQEKVVKRERLSGRELEWTNSPDIQTGTIDITVPRAAVVHTTAAYNGQAQQFYWVADPTTFQNARRASYEAFDPGLDILKDMVARAQGKGPDAKHFETAVSWLLWMLGFAPALLGGTPRTSDATDIVVCTPSGHFAVVEVTTGLLKAENKLAKLHERSQAVRRMLGNSNNSHIRVLPVIVTSKTREDVRPDLDQAERLGISVIVREDIDQLLTRIGLPANADKLYEDAEQAVRRAQDTYEMQGTLPLAGTPLG